MKRKIRVFVVTFLLLYSLSSSALADTLYDNGPINGTLQAWNLSAGYWVSNSFDLSGGSNLTGAQIGLWNSNAPVSMDWSIGTTYNNNTYGFGTATLTNTAAGTGLYGYSLWKSTFPLSLTLAAGTYWLTLQNAVGASYWDITNGPSHAWQSTTGDVTNVLFVGSNSSSFQIYGTSSVPEPATMLLLGLGLMGLAGVRRKFQD